MEPPTTSFASLYTILCLVASLLSCYGAIGTIPTAVTMPAAFNHHNGRPARILSSSADKKHDSDTVRWGKCPSSQRDIIAQDLNHVEIIASAGNEPLHLNNIQPQLHTTTSLKKIVLRALLGLWGVSQVIIIFGNALRRLLPVAIAPFVANDLSPHHWALYAVWTAYMAYTEGYKAFHLKFSPMVVERAFSISENPTPLKIVLAGPYCMGLFGASKQRMIVSWSVTAGVYALVKLVKRLPYPYRSIVDAGVVVGLSLGALSMFVKAWIATFKRSS